MNWKSDVKQRFSQAQDAGKWDDMYNKETENLEDAIFRQRRNATIEFIQKNYGTDAEICDIGCGAGPVTYELLRIGYTPFALDFSEDMLKNAKKRINTLNNVGCPLINGNSESLPFPDNYFDCVVCLGVISYVEHYENIIKEIERILKPGGTSIVTYRNSNNLILNDPVVIAKEFVKYITGMKKREEQPPFTIGHYMQYDEVLTTTKQAGLTLIDFKSMGFGPYHFNYKKLFSETTSIRIDRNLSRFFNVLPIKFFQKLANDVHMLFLRK